MLLTLIVINSECSFIYPFIILLLDSVARYQNPNLPIYSEKIRTLRFYPIVFFVVCTCNLTANANLIKAKKRGFILIGFKLFIKKQGALNSIYSLLAAIKYSPLLRAIKIELLSKYYFQY